MVTIVLEAAPTTTGAHFFIAEERIGRMKKGVDRKPHPGEISACLIFLRASLNPFGLFKEIKDCRDRGKIFGIRQIVFIPKIPFYPFNPWPRFSSFLLVAASAAPGSVLTA